MLKNSDFLKMLSKLSNTEKISTFNLLYEKSVIYKGQYVLDAMTLITCDVIFQELCTGSKPQSNR